MTQSTRYDSRQAGETLFQSKAEGGTFEKYYYRRPIENITNALEKNKQIEAQSGRHTRDQVLENMQVEANQAQVTLEHDMAVERINLAHDMEQWTKFSTAAGELFTQWGEARKKRQKTEGYLALSQLKTTKPELFQTYIDGIDNYRAQDGEFKAKLKRDAFRALFDANDLELAEVLFSKSNWHEHIIRESTFADRLQNVTYFYNQYRSKRKFSFPELGINDMTYDEWEALNPDMNDENNKAINRKFISANIVEVRKNHFIDQDVSPEMIVTKVDPALAAIVKQQAPDEVAKRKDGLYSKGKEGQRLQVKTAIQMGVGQGGNFSAQSIWQLIDQDWESFQTKGMSEKEARANSLANKLEMLLKMHAEGEKGINTIQLHQLANGKIFGGKENGQHRGLKPGTSKELQELAAEVFNRVDYWNRIQQVDMAKHGMKKYNQENAKKMAVQAVVEQVRTSGKPLSQVEHIEFARSLAERGYGKFSELFNAIEEAVPTIHGISVDGWVGEFKKARERNGLLHREDFPLGVPAEAFEQAKDLFHKDPKYYINLSDRRAFQSDFGKQVAIKQGKTVTGTTLPGHEYYSAGLNAYKRFTEIRDGIIADGTNVDPTTATEKAKEKVMLEIGKDSNSFMGPSEPLTEQNRAVTAHQKQLLTAKVDEVVLDGFEDQLKWAKERVDTARKNGYKGPIINLFPGDVMYRPEDGSPPVRFFNEVWDATAAEVGGTNVLLKSQLKAMGLKDDTKPTLPSDDKLPLKQTFPLTTPLDSSIFNQLKSDKTPYDGVTWGSLSENNLSEVLGTENWNPNMARISLRRFLKGCGIKNSDICSPEMITAVKERIWKLYGPTAYPYVTFNMEDGWEPPSWSLYIERPIPKDTGIPIK